jgi:Holliday junction resolvase RusA-like endonuclease
MAEFEHELSRDLHEEPPSSGELWLSITVPPVSLQSKKEARLAFERVIRDKTRKFKYLLSGDVTVEITLQVHQRDRYESDASPDLDNFLKPILDSLCGAEGLLIDDCQVASLGIDWISWVRDDTRLEIRIRFIETDYVNKEGLLFVQVEGALCMPVDTSLPVHAQRILLYLMRLQFRRRKLLGGLGADYYASSSILPIQRRFHRTRLKSFSVKNIKEYRRGLRFLRFMR